MQFSVFHMGTASLGRYVTDWPIKALMYRMALPYGMYICDDGREVLFNREYQPIWSRKDGSVTQANPQEIIPGKRQIWFYEEYPGPWDNQTVFKRCETVMRRFLECEDVNKYKVEEF